MGGNGYILLVLFLVFSAFIKGSRFLERKKLILKRAELAEKELEKELLVNLAKKNKRWAYFYFLISLLGIFSFAIIRIEP